MSVFQNCLLSMTDGQSTRRSSAFHITALLSFKTGWATAARLEKFDFFCTAGFKGLMKVCGLVWM